MSCFICRDNSNILYKLCTCESSTVCVDCYNLELTSAMSNCALCRKPYKFIKKRDCSKSFTLLSESFVKNWGFPFIDIGVPAFIYYHQKIELIYVLIIAFCIFFINNSNLHLIKSFISENDDELKKIINIVNVSKYTLIASTMLYIFFYRNGMFYIYLICVLLPVYIIPFVVLNAIIVYENISRYIGKLNRNTVTKRIKVRSTIYVDNSTTV